VARGGDGGPGRPRLGEDGRTAVAQRGEGRSRWRGEPAARSGRGRAWRARGGGGAGRRRRGDARGGGGERTTRLTKRVTGEKEERAGSLFSFFAECQRSGTRQRFF
jgi:hypothetical protein